MSVTVSLAKQSIGKRRPEYVDYSLPEGITNLKEFIIAIVKIEVELYNAPSEEPKPIPEHEIWTQSRVGKVGFKQRYNENQQDMEQAIETALLGYKDGLYRVFIDDEEVESLEDPVRVVDGTKVTLIRLTFLSGRLW